MSTGFLKLKLSSLGLQTLDFLMCICMGYGMHIKLVQGFCKYHSLLSSSRSCT